MPSIAALRPDPSGVALVTAEFAPLAKVGGLGDAVAGLARELALHDAITVILPAYRTLRREALEDVELVVDDLPVPHFDRTLQAEVRSARLAGAPRGLRLLLVGVRSEHRFFDRDRLYGFPDDVLRFAFFARAARELVVRLQPRVVHCHDWQAALLPTLLRDLPDEGGRPRTLLTIHNLAHQGVSEGDVVRQVGLDPSKVAVPSRLLHPGSRTRTNLLKGGLVDADLVNTVSRRYAEEIRNDPAFACGLESVLSAMGDRLVGILNGIDNTVWNPATDPHLAVTYDVERLHQRQANKPVLQRQAGLAVDAAAPLVAVVSRLDAQKGIQLMRHALRRCMSLRAQFILLGTAPDPAIQAEFEAIRDGLTDDDQVALELSFDEPLARRIYGGADILLVPSMFEPCGLTQLVAMRYGAVPVVRETGGLAETVHDANYSGRPVGEVNGYTFKDADGAAVDSALARAIGLYGKYPRYFERLRRNGMRADHSWRRAADEYRRLYRRAGA